MSQSKGAEPACLCDGDLPGAVNSGRQVFIPRSVVDYQMVDLVCSQPQPSIRHLDVHFFVQISHLGRVGQAGKRNLNRTENRSTCRDGCWWSNRLDDHLQRRATSGVARYVNVPLVSCYRHNNSCCSGSNDAYLRRICSGSWSGKSIEGCSANTPKQIAKMGDKRRRFIGRTSRSSKVNGYIIALIR